MSDPAIRLSQVRAVLLKTWDPIGVVDEPAAQDEYDAYAPAVLKLMESHASARAIADHLISIERDRMGLAGDKAAAERAADALLGLGRH